jgi:hypothetical protein
MLNKMCDIEFELLDEFYIKRGVLSGVQTYIQHFYNIKKNAKDPIERQFAKLMLNSAHGKFGQKINNEVIDLRGDMDLDPTEYTYLHGSLEKYEGFEPKTYLHHVKKERRISYLPNYIVITSMSRTMILKEIFKLTNRNYVNGDTDSVKFLINDETNNIDFNIGKELGQWKDEGTCSDYFVLGNKQYIYKVDGK